MDGSDGFVQHVGKGASAFGILVALALLFMLASGVSPDSLRLPATIVGSLGIVFAVFSFLSIAAGALQD